MTKIKKADQFTLTTLLDAGASEQQAKTISSQIERNSSSTPLKTKESPSPEEIWRIISKCAFVPRIPFQLYERLYQAVYENRTEPHPAWFPNKNKENLKVLSTKTNIEKTLEELNIQNYPNLHKWSIDHFSEFWDYVIKKLKIKFQTPYSKICDINQGIEKIEWLPLSKLNIAESCFQAPKNHPAILYQSECNQPSNASPLITVTYGELEKLVNRIANSIHENFKPGDALGIDMPMNIEAVAIYLAIVKSGCVVISIADSFAPPEIATRLNIASAKAIFTQDYYQRAGKKIKIYEKVMAADAPQAIVLPYSQNDLPSLRNNDIAWSDFISDDIAFNAIPCSPMDYTNILFSSGTTGTPKAIPWDHTTPIKTASDAYFHHDVQENDILAWPTNLGWMMGPWLIYATFINGGTMALFDGAPTGKSFGEFIEATKVTMLGLVPSLVRSWRSTLVMEDFDWSHIKLFSSTGECSSPDDYLYLMWLANNKPVIEYCGGTEIGGGYITGTLIQPATPSTCTTATLGLDFVMIDEKGEIMVDIIDDDGGNDCDEGEVALKPPSIGLSQTLLNRDHHQLYFADMPKYNAIPLRRHGDQIQKINDTCYRMLGRADDTMNLGGIKTSSAEIERLLNTFFDVKECAAVALQQKKHGPSQLVIFTVLNDPPKSLPDIMKKMLETDLKEQMQKKIKQELNPLFKVDKVTIIENLPRTASNKIMRRLLRDVR